MDFGGAKRVWYRTYYYGMYVELCTYLHDTIELIVTQQSVVE